MIIPGALGPSNQSRFWGSDVEQSINLFAERPQAGTPKADPIQPRRPALRPWAYLTSGPIREIYKSPDGRTFCVAGNKFVELYPNKGVTERGTVAVNSDPVTFAGNGSAGQQIMFVSGGLGYYFDLVNNDFFQITSDGFPENVLRCDYLNSRGLVLVKGTNTVFYSALNDFSTWTGEQFSTSLTADVKTGMIANGGSLWMLGEQRTEIWQATTDSATPYAPLAGTVIEQGAVAGFSAKRLDNAIFFIQGDERGNRMVMRTGQGYGFQRISTNALEFYLSGLSQYQITRTLGWSGQFEGHAIYGLFIPNAPLTPVYDVSTGFWFDWGHWDVVNLRWVQFRCRCACFAFDKILMGSPSDGTIYELTFRHQADAVVVP